MSQVYFDNAATTAIRPEVLERMIEVMREVPGNPSSTHAVGRKAKSIIAELGDLQDADSSLRLDSRYPNILIGKKKLDVSEIERFGERLRGLARKQLDVELGWNIEIYGMANDARLLQRSGQN